MRLLDKHSRAYQQHERERGLQDDESALEQGGAGGGGASSAAEGVGWIDTGRDQCGSDAEDDAGEERESEGKGEHHGGGAGFDGDVLRAGEGHGQEHAGSAVGDDKACGTADDGEDDALGEELADDAGAGAPNAVRMDISARRFIPRTSRRLAMLAQAMRRTRPEIHMSRLRLVYRRPA